MPDTVDPSSAGPYISGLETRVSTLEGDVRDLREMLPDLKAGMTRIETMLAATLPHLATKAELAEKPSKTYLWAVIGVLITAMFGAFGAGLAAVSILH